MEEGIFDGITEGWPEDKERWSHDELGAYGNKTRKLGQRDKNTHRLGVPTEWMTAITMGVPRVRLKIKDDGRMMSWGRMATKHENLDGGIRILTAWVFRRDR